ncbi:MAG: hypothetical protein QNJ97_09625 [Myxococcota bacterium]|nr:hypothetical protein [Myxococcota bacterium]
MTNTIEKKKKTGLLKDDRGLSTVEYIIILVLIAASCIGLWSKFGEKIHGKLSSANDELDTVEMIQGE